MELLVTEASNSLVRVSLVGSLDMGVTGQISLKFTASTVGRGKPTIVDLSETSFISSMGMGMLVTCYKGLRSKGAILVLLKPQASVEQALALAKLNTLFTITHDEDDALRLISVK